MGGIALHAERLDQALEGQILVREGAERALARAGEQRAPGGIAVEAGADTIEHPLPRSDATIKLMAKKGIAADPTLTPYMIIMDKFGGYFDSTSRRFTFSKEANLEMLKRLKRAGVKCGVGTDLVVNWYRYLPVAAMPKKF